MWFVIFLHIGLRIAWYVDKFFVCEADGFKFVKFCDKGLLMKFNLYHEVHLLLCFTNHPHRFLGICIVQLLQMKKQ